MSPTDLPTGFKQPLDGKGRLTVPEGVRDFLDVAPGGTVVVVAARSRAGLEQLIQDQQ